MGFITTIGCYLVAFSPAFAIFCRFVAPDPLRTILFVLGAFLWLIALLVSSLLHLLFGLFWPNLYFIVAVSIVLQEGAKVGYFAILKRAQHGLNKMAKNGGEVTGISDLHNARHMMALVCGLGMGVMAALFATMNIFATFAGPYSLGLPEALANDKHDVNPAGQYLPLYYALSGQLLALFHVTWTIMIWDTCHRFRNGFSAYFGAAIAVLSHFCVSVLSAFNASGWQPVVIPSQYAILLMCVIFCHYIIGGNLQTLGGGIISAVVDWVTLSWLRQKCCQKETQNGADEEEPMEQQEQQ